MSDIPIWSVWLLALVVVGLVVWYFWHTAGLLLALSRRLVVTIQSWPETRRQLAEAEAQAGGRHPLWLRTVRFSLIATMVALCALLVWRKFGGA